MLKPVSITLIKVSFPLVKLFMSELYRLTTYWHENYLVSVNEVPPFALMRYNAQPHLYMRRETGRFSSWFLLCNPRKMYRHCYSPLTGWHKELAVFSAECPNLMWVHLKSGKSLLSHIDPYNALYVSSEWASNWPSGCMLHILPGHWFWGYTESKRLAWRKGHELTFTGIVLHKSE